MRNVLINLAFVTVPTIVLLIALLEIVFRIIIPASTLPFHTNDAVDSTSHYEPGRSGLYTQGRYAEIRGRWRINNYGWNSAIDYVPSDERTKPLIAVIGDSYVEGFHVDVEQHIDAVLRDHVGTQYDVYSFGASGAPLSQYLQFARYAERVFDPDIFIVVVIHNDFDESIASLVTPNSHRKLDMAGDTVREIPPSISSARPLTRLVLKSALVRYLVFNLNVYAWWTEVRNRDISPVESDGMGEPAERLYEANVEVSRIEEHLDVIRRAVGYVVERFAAEFPDAGVVFVIDGPRDLIYDGALDSARITVLNRILREATDTSRVGFVDLTEAFARHFAEHGVSFNPAIDGHWNELGHRIGAETTLDSLRSWDWLNP